MRICDHWFTDPPASAPFWASSNPNPLCASAALHCSILSVHSSWILTVKRIRIFHLTLMRIRNLLFTVMRIRIQIKLPKMIRIWIRNTVFYILWCAFQTNLWFRRFWFSLWRSPLQLAETLIFLNNLYKFQCWMLNVCFGALRWISFFTDLLQHFPLTWHSSKVCCTGCQGTRAR